ncbi:MAG TPA: DUF3788 family protein [bacterium]|jgi:hypothetical protein
MPTLPQNAFPDKTKKPSEKDLAGALGPAAALWTDFLNHIREHCAPLSEEWKHGKTGWMMVSKKKTRTVCYLFPGNDHFTVAFVLGEKAVEVMRQSKLPKRIMDSMEAARPYAEGRGFYVECSKPADLKHLLTLVTIKMDS